MKKIIATLLAVCMAVSLITVPACAYSLDFSKLDWQSIINNWVSKHYPVEKPEESEEPIETAPAETEEPEEVEEYTIRYDANGGIWYNMNASPVTKNASYVHVQAGESTKTLNAPTRGGYSFAGWELPDGTILKAREEFTPNEDMTIKAKWKYNGN